MKSKRIWKTFLIYTLVCALVMGAGLLASIALDVYVYTKIGQASITEMIIGEKVRVDEFEMKFDQITVGEYTWNIENQGIATIEDNQINAIGIGHTKVTVYDGVGSMIHSFELRVGFAVKEVDTAVRASLELAEYDNIYKEQLESVETLDLNGIEFSTLSDLYVFKNIKNLNLSGTNIEGVSLSAGSDLVLNLSKLNIKVLDLSNTVLQDITPFYGYEGIESLRVSNTVITAVDYKSLPKSIKTLDVSGTKLDKIETFEDTTLTELYAENLMLKRVILGGTHQGLEKISLKGTTAESIEMNGKFEAVTYLNLENLKIANSIVLESEMQKIKNISFANSTIQTLHLAADMAGLEMVNTAGCTINTLKLDAKFSNWKSVAVEDCSLQSVLFTPSCMLPAMNKLTIANTGVSAIEIKASDLGNLSAIDLSGNNLTSFELALRSDFITSINLANNQIKNFKLSQDYINLSSIDLSGNDKISIFFEGEFDKLNDVKLGAAEIVEMVFDGSFNKLPAINSNGSILKSLTLAANSSFPALKEILLDSSNIQNLKLDANIDGLQVFSIANNSFDELKLSKSYPKLRKLNISGVIIKQAIDLSGQFPELVLIDAKNIKADSIQINGEFGKLEEILLSGTEVNSASIIGIINTLQKMDWQNTSISIASIKGEFDAASIMLFAGARIGSLDFDAYFGKLSAINLSDANMISRIDFEDSSSLPELIDFNVSGIGLENISFGGHFPKLNILNMSGNQLSVLEIPSNCMGLTVVNASSNPLLNIQLNDAYDALQELDISNCGNVENVNLSGSYNSLSKFVFNGTNMKTLTFNAFFGNLVSLDLSKCVIGTLDFTSNCNFDSLLTLNLSNLGLSSFLLNGGFNHLKTLNLESNNFTQFNLNVSLNTLEVLNIANNKFLKNLIVSVQCPSLHTINVSGCNALDEVNIDAQLQMLSNINIENAVIGKISLKGNTPKFENIVSKTAKVGTISFGPNSATNLKKIDISGAEFLYENMSMPMPFVYKVAESVEDLKSYSKNIDTSFVLNCTLLGDVTLNEIVKISQDAKKAGYYCKGTSFKETGFEFISGATSELWFYELNMTAINGNRAINTENVTVANLYFTGVNTIKASTALSNNPLATIYASGGDLNINSRNALIVTAQSAARSTGNGVLGVAGAVAISAKNLTIVGNVDFCGGNGGNGIDGGDSSTGGSAGGAGGAAISVSGTLTFNSAIATLRGGNGGNAGSAVYVSSETGLSGGAGGNGGDSIIANKLTLNSSNVTTYAGNGGAGGNGYTGAAGGAGDSGNTGENGTPGDNGGNGGAGGAGGNAGRCLNIITTTISYTNSKISVYGGAGGAGGNGGNGGAGGAGGNGGSGRQNWVTHTNGGNGAKGGNGGAGGRGGDGGNNDLYNASSVFSSNETLITISSKGTNGKGGAGGKGGNGGNGGNGGAGPKFAEAGSGGPGGSAGSGGAGGANGGNKGLSGSSGSWGANG